MEFQQTYLEKSRGMGSKRDHNRKTTEPDYPSPIKYPPVGADDELQKISDILVNICSYMNISVEKIL